MKKIWIQGDTNDADYVSEMTDITEEELESIIPIIEAIKDCKEFHNWQNEYDDITIEELYPQFFKNGEELPEMEYFYELLPCGEYGIHSITEIKVFEVVNEQQLL